MLHDIFLNATIVVSFISLGNQFIYRENKISAHSSKLFRFFFGMLAGCLGCILMLFSVDLVPHVILDLRNFAIIIASLFGGFLSSLVASLIIGLFRITYFGLGTASLLAFCIALIMGICCPIIARKTPSLKYKWANTTLICTVLGSLAYMFLIKDSKLLITVIIVYWICNFVNTLILSNYIKYLSHINELYRNYKEQSSIDFLTGLNNVRSFDRVFNDVSSKAIEKGEYLALLFIDIDFFKRVNDTYGHSEGDGVLRELGEVLSKTCRSFDIISRNGGEEFSVLLIDCPPDLATMMAEHVRCAVEKHSFKLSNGLSISITISIGVAVFPSTENEVSKLIEQADKALYKAKRTGRNRVVLWHEEAVCIC